MPRRNSPHPPERERRRSNDRRVLPRGGRRVSDPVQSEGIPKRAASPPPLILVVDDFSETDARCWPEGIAAFLGFRIATAQTGAEAVAAVVALGPDLVIMDVLLPGRRWHRRHSPNPLESMQRPRRAIVVCTAVVMGDVRARAKDAKVDLFVPKPCDLRLLAQRIGHLLLPAVVVAHVAPTSEATSKSRRLPHGRPRDESE